MKTLTPAAEDFLEKMAARNQAFAESLRQAMTDGTITHLEDEPVLQENDARQLVLAGGVQMRLYTPGGRT